MVGDADRIVDILNSMNGNKCIVSDGILLRLVVNCRHFSISNDVEYIANSSIEVYQDAEIEIPKSLNGVSENIVVTRGKHIVFTFSSESSFSTFMTEFNIGGHKIKYNPTIETYKAIGRNIKKYLADRESVNINEVASKFIAEGRYGGVPKIGSQDAIQELRKYLGNNYGATVINIMKLMDLIEY